MSQKSSLPQPTRSVSRVLTADSWARESSITSDKDASPRICAAPPAAVDDQMKFSMETGIRPDDPTIGVKRVKIKTTGYATWTEDDITRFETKHPIGTRARLALALLLYTGQRRSDVVRLGRQHIRDGVIYVRQQKTAAELAIPIHAQLRAVLDATPSDHLTFLTTAAGKPFTAPGFTNWFREKCKEAEIPKGLSAHGLRKSACRRLAEAGCSANEIAAISGHATLREVERYTRAADQARMARAAIGRLAMAVPDAENKTRR